ncbi:hypothetical protein M9Y10_009268 [Tritrichomonas musculus]|uniref:Uncharacterized protein n=1 Tax=Tritrichomonas musculus TaxID=1915356 RepID=A0ABR2IMU7_9EUKA
MEQTQYKNVELYFGDLKAKIVATDAPKTIQILGFVQANRSTEFTSMNPIFISEGEFLQSLAISMAKNSLDAVAFDGRDLIIRAEVIISENSDEEKDYILFLCVPSKPLFDQASPSFSFPDYSLFFQNT